MKRGGVTSGADYNSFTQSGVYYVSYDSASDVKNAPTTSYKYGTLVVLDGGVYLAQLFVPDSSTARMYVRSHQHSKNTWTKWQYASLTSE